MFVPDEEREPIAGEVTVVVGSDCENEHEDDRGEISRPRKDKEKSTDLIEDETRRQYCAYGLLGGAVFFAVAAAVITGVLVYTSSKKIIDESVEDRALAILSGAVAQVSRERDDVEFTNKFFQGALADDDQNFTDPLTALKYYNTTLYETFTMEVIGTNLLTSVGVGVLGPKVADIEAIPVQDLEAQKGCYDLCRRPGDPLYTDVAYLLVTQDFDVNLDSTYRFVISENQTNFANHYQLLPQNGTQIRPDWAAQSTSIDAVIGDFIVQKNVLPTYENGSAYGGLWTPPTLTSGLNGNFSFYVTSFKQAFVLPVSKLNVVVTTTNALVNYRDILTSQLVTDDDLKGHLLIVDDSPQVLAYNRDPYGDSRLKDCGSDTSLTFLNSTRCGSLQAYDHPSEFIRWLFNTEGGYILGDASSVNRKWISHGGTRYLLVVRDVANTPTSRLIALYVVADDTVYGGLVSTVLTVVIVSSAIVLFAVLFLALISFLALRDAQRTVVLVARLATCIARYDVDAAEKAIHDEQGGRICCKGATALEEQFEHIIDNLRAYQPFLPPSLLMGRHTTITSPSDESSRGPYVSTSSVGSIPVAMQERFRAFQGTVLLVDLGNLPIPANVNAGQGKQQYADDGGLIINRFLEGCIQTVEKHNGVVDVVQANQLIASFNCHSRVVRHEDAACRCALAIRSELRSEVECGNGTLFQMNVAIAVASGSGLVGSGGSDSVKARMLTGEPVDLVMRMPGLQRMLGVGIIATEATSERLSTTFVSVPVDVVAPRWLQSERTKTLVVYEIVGWAADSAESQLRQMADSRTAAFRALYHQQDPTKAKSLLESGSSTGDRMSFSESRLLKLSEVADPRKRLVRAELSWDALEGRSFFDSHSNIAAEAFLSSATLSTTTERSDVAHQLQKAEANVRDDDRPLEFKEVDPHEGGGGSLFSMFVAADGEDSGPLEDLDIGTSISRAPDAHEMEVIISSESTSSPNNALLSSSARSFDTKDSRVIEDVYSERYYTTTRVLGKGAYGEVVLALHEAGNFVAMKTLPIKALEGGVDALVKEVAFLSRLNHPNIASYVSCAVQHKEGIFCIMTEYLAAGSLQSIISSSWGGAGSIASRSSGSNSSEASALPLRTVISYARDILRGLQYLHSREPPILHCDVKPENVLMTPDGSCKLIDFGTSKFFLGLNSSMTIRGTPRYMAPEAAVGEFSPASDVYSVGITVLQMLMGRLPWEIGGDDNSFLMRLAREESLKPTVPDWIDSDLRELLIRCTARDPAQRPTAGELLESLVL